MENFDTPSFLTYFKSFYYPSETFLPPVDLSEQNISRYFLEKIDAKVAKIAQRVLSHPEVQEILSNLSTITKEGFIKKAPILKKHGFQLLQNITDEKSLELEKIDGEPHPPKLLSYSVLKHRDLPGWIIKPLQNKGIRGFDVNGTFITGLGETGFQTEDEGILRIEMCNRIKKIAQGLDFAVIVPKKGLVPYSHLENTNEVYKKYCVICEELDILTPSQIRKAMPNLSSDIQKKFARDICDLIQKVGFFDAGFRNISFAKGGKIGIFDTEPNGVMIKKNSLISRGLSVEACARNGLYYLLKEVDPVAGLEPFRDEVRRIYMESIRIRYSSWKIAASILCPLIPVAIAVASAAVVIFLEIQHQKLDKEIAECERQEKSESLNIIRKITQKILSIDDKYLKGIRDPLLQERRMTQFAN